MDDREERELEDPNSWDDESVEVHPAVQSPRAVVSVSFSREELQIVSEYAKAHGKKVSTFIREAALERATRSERGGQSGPMTISSGQGGYINQDFTAASTVRVETNETTRHRT